MPSHVRLPRCDLRSTACLPLRGRARRKLALRLLDFGSPEFHSQFRLQGLRERRAELREEPGRVQFVERDGHHHLARDYARLLQQLFSLHNHEQQRLRGQGEGYICLHVRRSILQKNDCELVRKLAEGHSTIETRAAPARTLCAPPVDSLPGSRRPEPCHGTRRTAGRFRPGTNVTLKPSEIMSGSMWPLFPGVHGSR